MSSAGRGRPSARHVRIRAARAEDLSVLIEIERAAGGSFGALGMDRVADGDPPPVDELAAYAASGRALVAASASDRPVGYLLVDLVDGAGHVEQVSVHPSEAGHGLGRALIEAAAAWACSRRAAGLDAWPRACMRLELPGEPARAEPVSDTFGSDTGGGA